MCINEDCKPIIGCVLTGESEAVGTSCMIVLTRWRRAVLFDLDAQTCLRLS